MVNIYQLLSPDGARRFFEDGRPDDGIGVRVIDNGYQVWHPAGRIVGIALALDSADGDGLLYGYVPLAHETGRNADPLTLSVLIEYLSVRPLVCMTSHTFQWLYSRWGCSITSLGDPFIAAGMLAINPEAVTHQPYREWARHDPLDPSLLDAQDGLVIPLMVDEAAGILTSERALAGRLREQNLGSAYTVEREAALLLAEMSLRGYALDEPRMLTVAKEIETQLGRDEVELRAVLGRDVDMTLPASFGPALNAIGIASPLLTPVKKTQSWSQGALQVLVERPDCHPIVPKLLAYRKHLGDLSALRAWKGAEADGSLHPSWVTVRHESGSGRIWASGPLLLQFPIVARRAFVAPEGYRWVAFTLAGLPNAFLDVLAAGAHRAVYDTVVRRTAADTGRVTSWLGRSYVVREGLDPVEAVVEQSTWMFCKMLLYHFAAQRLYHPRMFEGLRQIIPTGATIAYCLSNRVDIQAHGEFVTQMVQASELPGVTISFETGPSWGELQPMPVLIPRADGVTAKPPASIEFE